MTDLEVKFEFIEDFDIVRLENAVTDASVFSHEFASRHRKFLFTFKLAVKPRGTFEKEEFFGLYLHLDGGEFHSADVELFAGNNKEVSDPHVRVKVEDGYSYWGRATFLPRLASLYELCLVEDGCVRLGAKITLKESDFDPFNLLQLPSMTTNTGHIVRQLFDNLGTDNHRGTDFVLVVGEGEARMDLHVNRLALSVVPFFDKMFSNDKSTENQQGVLQLPTHSVGAVIQALRFIYLNEIGWDLTRFVPSLLVLASEWNLEPLIIAIQKDMIEKLHCSSVDEDDLRTDLRDRYNTDLAAEYLGLTVKYHRRVAGVVAMCHLMDAWPHFIRSPKGKQMNEALKDQMTCVMAAICKCVRKEVSANPLDSLPPPSLTPNAGHIARQLFANLGTDDRRCTDFVIAVGEGEEKTELHVSSVALTVVPYFDTMFGNDKFKENQQGVLQLPMHTVDAVKEALRFVYLNEVGEDLTRFLPSLLSLASEWQLDDLTTAIEQDMIRGLEADRFNSEHEIAATYYELADIYDLELVMRLSTDKLIASWPEFIVSQKGKDMQQKQKAKITCVMADIIQRAGNNVD